MSVQSVLEQNKASGRGSLIGYFPAGYPTVEDSIEAFVALAKNGCDILEVGVPYSDPVMDGVVIQKATEKALANGFRLSQVFDVIRGVREQVDTPMLVMSYYNPVLRYGVERFATELKACGAQGMITPDLIPDEASQWLRSAEQEDLDRVFLVAPSSSDARVQANTEASRGFVYSVSTMGITGERAELDKLAREVASRVRTVGAAPTCVGVGVSTGAQVRDVNSYADGAIVGTALIAAYESAGLEGLIEKTRELASGLG